PSWLVVVRAALVLVTPGGSSILPLLYTQTHLAHAAASSNPRLPSAGPCCNSFSFICPADRVINVPAPLHFSEKCLTAQLARIGRIQQYGFSLATGNQGAEILVHGHR